MSRSYSEEHGHEHPLSKEPLSYIKSWSQWKELWDGTRLAESRHSLLHFGLKVGVMDFRERVEQLSFYLDVADMHREGLSRYPWRHLNESDRVAYRHTPFGKGNSGIDLQKIVAEKAFSVLCNDFFCERWQGPRVTIPSWARLFARKEFLEKILWFFRVDEAENLLNAPRFSSDHHIQVARQFACDMCDFVFEFECLGNYPLETDYEIRRQFRSFWPKFIPLVCSLQKTRILLRNYHELDEESLAALRRVALDKDIFPPGEHLFRKPISIEEACYFRSVAAEALILLGVLREEAERQRKIAELKEAEKEAKRELAKLQA